MSLMDNHAIALRPANQLLAYTSVFIIKRLLVVRFLFLSFSLLVGIYILVSHQMHI